VRFRVGIAGIVFEPQEEKARVFLVLIVFFAGFLNTAYVFGEMCVRL
jgi:hypothetical protein